MKNIKEKFKEKNGIAFIITLGLLAVLMITGVSFAVFMKVEREAAANFALVGSCRQLALAGIAYAMDDISYSLDDDPDNDEFDWYPQLTNTWSSYDAFHGWYTTVDDFESSFTDDSSAEDEYDFLVNRLYYNNALAKTLIPEKTFENARKIYSTERISTYDVFGDGEFSDTDNDEEGTFKGNASYIVVNLSGVLDPNFDGGSARGIGGAPGEFQMTELPGVTSWNNPGYYDTIVELKKATGVDENLECLYPFSMFVDNGASSKFEVYTNAADYELADLRNLANVLIADVKVSGSVDTDFDTGQKLATVLNFIDYLDDDNIPANGNSRLRVPGYETPCVEAFPMINEIYLSSSYNSRVIGDQYKYKMTAELYIELWYPFVSPACADNYALEYTIRFGPTDLEFVNNGINALDLIPDEVVQDDSSATHTDRDWTEKISLTPANLNTDSNSGLWVMGNRTFRFQDNDWRQTDLTNITMNLPAGSMVISVDAKIVDKDDSSIIYDAFDWDVNGSDDPFMIQFANFDETAIDGASQRINDEFDTQVVDPRLNYRVEIDGTTCWEDMSSAADPDGNLLEINDVTQDYIADTDADAYADSGWQMFIKGYEGNPNSVFLESIGEFGYVFTGRPWETVRLLDKNSTVTRHQVYESLYLEGSGLTNSGCANINTEYEDVLRAALKDMPTVPDLSETIADDKLTALVAKIQELAEDGGISSTNLLSTANQTEILTALGVDLTTGTEFEKEAFYISGYPAFNSGQNLFAIFSMGNYYLSKQICMAIVWRDPVPDEDGNHPCFIRELTWLNGE